MIAAVASPTLTALATAVLHVDRSPERALEVACGDGDGVTFLAREFPGARVRGVDPDPSLLRAATERIGLDPEGRVAFKHGRRRSLPFPDDFFDLVAQRHGRLFTPELARVLRPGGHLVYVFDPARRLSLRTPLRRLSRAGFEPVQSGEADGRSFYVGRLGGG